MNTPHLLKGRYALALACATTWILGVPMAQASTTRAEEAPSARHAEVEVVFLLDTTGSMSGLIEAAKQKIWSIANEIAKGTPTPKIRMGLIAYRDRGDAYVTQVFDLNTNLDRMYKELLGLNADGGGDGPEHVLQALSDAVEKISWSRDPKAFKVVYLVGDAPPHFDYKDTPPLEELLQKAVRRGLIVNAVQCGGDTSTTATWQKIARLSEGKFLPIPQAGGVVAIATPFDDRIATLSARLGRTMLPFGETRSKTLLAMATAGAIAAEAPVSAIADRAAYKSRDGYFDSGDLAEAVQREEATLETLADSDLPDGLRGLTLEEKKARLDAILQERAMIQQELSELSAKRGRYLDEELKKTREPEDSFDAKLIESIKEQASRKGITY